MSRVQRNMQVRTGDKQAPDGRTALGRDAVLSTDTVVAFDPTSVCLVWDNVETHHGGWVLLGSLRMRRTEKHRGRP